jgi:catechol 2,3-dioxygenase-like lactoylglutathione lyase family enzyme
LEDLEDLMSNKLAPMIHVPDVRATVEFYESIGFNVVATYADETGEGLSFAIMSFGPSEVMFNQNGETSTKPRREVDLYVNTDEVDDLYQRLKDRVDVVEGPHDTFYGMREVIIRDLNRFWITFGEESAFAKLMSGVRETKTDLVREAVGRLDVETLNAALAAALEINKDAEAVKILQSAGATPPPEIDPETMQSYVGNYKGDHGMAAEISIKEGRLYVTPTGQQPMSLWPLDQRTFKPIAIAGAKLIFNVEKGSLTFIQDGFAMELKRA